jgi:DNA-binding XRE family transcriptional regulator
MAVPVPNSGLRWRCWSACAVQFSKHPEDGRDPVELCLSIPRYPGRTVGARIRRLRLEQALYQKHLAELVGVDEMTIVNWEKDRTVPKGERLNRLARILGVEVRELT